MNLQKFSFHKNKLWMLPFSVVLKECPSDQPRMGLKDFPQSRSFLKVRQCTMFGCDSLLLRILIFSLSRTDSPAEELKCYITRLQNFGIFERVGRESRCLRFWVVLLSKPPIPWLLQRRPAKHCNGISVFKEWDCYPLHSWALEIWQTSNFCCLCRLQTFS